MNYQIISAFPTPIGITKVSQEFCEPLKKLKGQYQGEQTEDSDFFVLDKLPDLKKKLIKLFSNYINLKILHTPNQEYTITTSWLTENTTGDPMLTHCHVNSYYSSIFYFDKVSKEHPPLSLGNPRARSEEGFWVKPLRITEFNCRSIEAPIEEGLIIFFPSYLYHSYPRYEPTDVIRKSLACNYIPINQFGKYDSTLDTRRIHG